MNILYGVVGEGMGHATRSRVILEHLLSHNINIRVVVSGHAHKFLTTLFKHTENITIEEIHGLSIDFEDNAVDIFKTIFNNLIGAPIGILENLATYVKLIEDGFIPDMVISDFESWAYFYAINHGIPVVSIDNMQVLNRCQHGDDVTNGLDLDYILAKTIVKMKLPGAYHYLVSSFFFPPVSKERTTLLPPILRPEILEAKREIGSHILVYPSVAMREKIIDYLKPLPYEFRIYGMKQKSHHDNITIRPFSEQDFIDDFRTAKAVIAGGGFSMMSEAVHLRVPMLAIPIEGQYEQELNSRYLKKLGYGDWTRALNKQKIASFLDNTEKHQKALQKYTPHDNKMLLRCLDELIRDVLINEPPPVRLTKPAKGKYYGTPLADEEIT